jgi:hypothetical protein
VPRLQPGYSIEQTPEVSDIRVLKRAELSVLAEKRPPNSLQTLRDTHHRVARAVAAGLRGDEIAATTGYSYQRVSILKSDPAFMELVAHYRAILTAEWASEADPVIDYMRTNSLKAQAMISDKLDAAMEANEFLPTRDLLGIAEFGADRTGYGKVNKNVNINVDFAKQLEEARQRSASVRAPRQIEHSPPLAQSQPQQQSPPDHAVAGSLFRRL